MDASKTQAKHTPGPWFVGPDGIHVYDKRVWWDEDGSRCGETPNLVVSVAPEMPANARLIAAAPDLLAACQLAACHSFMVSGDPLLLQLRAAIAKATGTEV